jgi:prophage regulatory protein
MLPQILRRKQLEAQLGLSRSSIYLMMSQGRFPRPIKLGRRSVGWRTVEIERWLDEMQEASDE